jgi:mRNA-degrading endonuclease RelE of RelBE toxin-antitoxin system
MPDWRWELTSAAGRELGRLSPEQRRRVVQKLEDLVAGAPNIDLKKIGNDEYRMRVGTLRVIFARDSEERLITVTRIADRKDVYR